MSSIVDTLTAPRRARPRRPRLRALSPSLIAVLLGGAIALWAQFSVAEGASGESVLVSFAIAVALFVAGIATGPSFAQASLLSEPEPADPRADPPANRPLLLAAVGLGVVTFLLSGGNRFTLLNTSTWIASIVLAVVALTGPVGTRLRRLRVPRGWTLYAFLAIWLFGTVLLFHRLADVPREMTSDHAEKLLDVRDVLNGEHRIFFPRNTGREAMQFYLIALLTPVAGLTYGAMKLSTALVAAATPLFTFLLSRVLFGARAALLATAILVVTRWHLQLARVGLRYSFSPLFAAAVYYFLFKAIRDRRRADFVWCGLALGVAQHTYTPLRIAALGVAVCLVITLAVDVMQLAPPRRVQRLVTDSALLILVAFLVFVPLGRFAIDEPAMFLYRGATRLASDSLAGPPANALAVFLLNVKNALLMFNWRGDVAWLAGISGERAVDPVSGALLVLGLGYAVYRLVRHRERTYAFLLVAAGSALLPSILSLAFPQENPSVVRSGMVVPFVAILVALPLVLAARHLTAALPGTPGFVTATVLLGGALLAIGRINYEQYFEVYARHHTASSQHTRLIAEATLEFMASGGQRRNVFLISWPHWVDTRLVAIQAGDIEWNPLIQDVAQARAHEGAAGPRLYVVHPDDAASLAALQTWYPTSVRKVHTLGSLANQDRAQPWFVTVQVAAP